MTQMLGAFAEFERAMIRERTMNGLAHARKAGRHLGRRPSLTGPQRAEIIAKAEYGQGSPAQLATRSACRARPCSAYCASTKPRLPSLHKHVIRITC